MVSRIKGFIPPALVALLLLLSCASITAGQDANRRLLELPIQKVKIKEAANVHLALSALANEYGVPIGLEVAANFTVVRSTSLAPWLRGLLTDVPTR